MLSDGSRRQIISAARFKIMNVPGAIRTRNQLTTSHHWQPDGCAAQVIKGMKDMFDDSCKVGMRSPRYARDDKGNAPGEIRTRNRLTLTPSRGVRRQHKNK